jgi:hypothetical protein
MGGESMIRRFGVQILISMSLWIVPTQVLAGDTEQIGEVFKSTLTQWNKQGIRTSFGPWNNFLRFLGDLSGGRVGNQNFLGCFEQAIEMKKILEQSQFKNGWTFKEMNNEFHHWLEARSKNPQEPPLIIDPWKGAIIRKSKSWPG